MCILSLLLTELRIVIAKIWFPAHPSKGWSDNIQDSQDWNHRALLGIIQWSFQQRVLNAELVLEVCSNAQNGCSLAQLEKLVCTLCWSFLRYASSVALPSGCSQKFSIPQSSKVGDLRALAQKSCQRGFLGLVAADHSVMDPTLSLQAAGLEDGDRLTAAVTEAKLVVTATTFALFCWGGDRVVTWGQEYFGGDSSEVQYRLKGAGRFKQLSAHLLQYWLMGQSWLGGHRLMVVTALKSKISWRASSSFK